MELLGGVIPLLGELLGGGHPIIRGGVALLLVLLFGGSDPNY